MGLLPKLPDRVLSSDYRMPRSRTIMDNRACLGSMDHNLWICMETEF
jgi:hypothetical protein